MEATQLGEPAGAGGNLSEPAFQDFRTRFHGALRRPGDVDYDAVRKVWNGMIDRRPALIARCTGAADVIAAVDFARDQELTLSVRGGGHNVAGSAVCDGGLMLDLSLMREVQVNPETRTARVQGGATWGDLDRAAQVFGLATPGGVHSLTGVAGLTLGGGYGWLRRKYGLSCDNLLAVEIVTADGQQLRASPAEHPDLFWALRGGGGNFGVVTWFEFQLNPVGPMVYLSGPAYPLEQAGTVGRRWLEFMQTAPEEFTGNLTFMSFPDLPNFPPAARGRALVIPVVIAAGSPEAGEQSTRPLRQLGDPLLDLSQTLPYAVLQTFNDASFPAGTLQHYWKSVYVDNLNSEVIDAIALLAASRPSPSSMVSIWHFGGAMSRVEPGATAFWHRQAPFMVSFDATWENPADAEKNIAWSRNACAELRKYSGGGAYVNFPGLGEDGEAQVRAAYGGNYERLVAVKNQYDPANLFRHNLNIKPTVRVHQGI